METWPRGRTHLVMMHADMLHVVRLQNAFCHAVCLSCRRVVRARELIRQVRWDVHLKYDKIEEFCNILFLGLFVFGLDSASVCTNPAKTPSKAHHSFAGSYPEYIWYNGRGSLRRPLNFSFLLCRRRRHRCCSYHAANVGFGAGDSQCRWIGCRAMTGGLRCAYSTWARQTRWTDRETSP